MREAVPVLLLSLFLFLVPGCSAIKPPVTNQYTLNGFSHQSFNKPSRALSILVNKPETVAGYETEQMLYINKPYEVGVFAHNAWIDPPADMLFSLIVQSLQSSGYFFAVASTPSSESADYRLDTQLIELQQNFLDKPSVLEFAAKIVLTKVSNNNIIASLLIKKRIPCPKNTPYGGVIAANQATRQFTAELTRFVIRTVDKTT
ncbi:MAG: hypothetical protein A3F46_05185 [Legionellales bacterium RIFCSPHIGHO2_12_FULL_42_9]|nr:MAG: hypothetical protein A3F46_05185 [Legionellales bacterium RIFCSPHIGHO2_12_FULL_42_9]